MDFQKHFSLLQNKEVDELYVNLGLRAFSFGLISVFIPLFFLSLGYSLIDVFVFFGLFSFFHIIFIIPAAYLSSKWGFKHVIIASQPFLILFFVSLYLLESSSIPLVLISFFLGVYSALFWFAFHADFAENSRDGERGKEVAFANIISSVASAVAPIIGALVIVYLNFSYLLVFVILIILASIIPLLLTEDKKDSVDFSLKKIFANRNLNHSIG